MQIVVDGLLTHYELRGTGKLVVLLHGWGDNLQSLSKLQSDLSERYQTLSIDLPGFGGTQIPPTTWDLTNYANFVAQTIKKLGLAEPYALLGHSNGGAVSVVATGTSVLQPKKLVLIASSGMRTKGGAKRLVLKTVAKTGNLATLWMPRRYREALRKSLYSAAGSDYLVVPALQDTFKKTVRQDVSAEAAQITVPTLLLFADGDQAVPVSDGEQFKQLIKKAKLKVIKNSGHFVHLDQPQEVTKRVMDFLK